MVRETFDSAVQMGWHAVQALGATRQEADEVIAELRRRDAARFAEETVGGEFAGRDLLLKNTAH